MNAKNICEALGGTWFGNSGLAFCPAHNNRNTPALSIRNAPNGTLLAYCFAGCQFKEILAGLHTGGILDGTDEQNARHHTSVVDRKDTVVQRNSAYVRKIWGASRPIQGTLAHKYLASRGIGCALPDTLRYHSELLHSPSKTRYPALLAVIKGSSGFAIHRTFLALDGSSKAPVSPAKMMLGPTKGGAVHLGADDGTLMIGEGIETCLSGAQVSGLPAWAALSTSGMKALVLPDHISDIIFLADGDDAGEAAALDCARRSKRPDRRIRIARPPRGLDFNDLLMRGQDLFGDVTDV